jgi:hypothetical protein
MDIIPHQNSKEHTKSLRKRKEEERAKSGNLETEKSDNIDPDLSEEQFNEFVEEEAKPYGMTSFLF